METLRALRLWLGIPQKAAAYGAGLCRTIYAGIESGRIIPSPSEILEIAKALGIPPQRVLASLEEAMKRRSEALKVGFREDFL